MERTIKLTSLVALGSCIVIIILIAIAYGLGAGFYAGILTFGNIILPTLGIVVLYRFVERWITFASMVKTTLLQIAVILLIQFSALFIWAMVDAILLNVLTWESIKADYNSQFAGFLPVVISEALFIPVFNSWLKTRD